MTTIGCSEIPLGTGPTFAPDSLPAVTPLRVFRNHPFLERPATSAARAGRVWRIWWSAWSERDCACDTTYLKKLEAALPQVTAHEPDLVFYLAGADPFDGDQLGNLKLTKDGLRKRDRQVLRAMRESGLPVVTVLAGGYAKQLTDTVDIHLATIDEALTLRAS